MRGRKIIATVFALLGTALLPVASASANTPAATVEVRDTEFLPQAVRIEPGQTVAWTARDPGHTVTADNGAFSFPNDGAPTMAAGSTHTFTFPEPGVFAYRCKLHGARDGYPNGMTGAVYVGVDPESVSPQTRAVPSAEYPTVEDATRDIPEGSTITVEPGTYHLDNEIQLNAEGLTLRPSREGAVVFRPGPNGPESGIIVATDRVTVRGITLRGFTWSGVRIDGARDVALDHIAVEDAGRFGIEAIRPARGVIADAVVTGASSAGVFLRDCRDYSCPAVTDSQVTASADGVVIEGRAVASIRSTLLDVRGTGVRLTMAAGALVRHNVVRAGQVGVDVGLTSLNTSVVDNIVDSDVGLRWDATGTGVCFSRNTTAAGGQPASFPPAVQQLFACPG